MNKVIWLAGVVGLLGAAAACGGDDERPNVIGSGATTTGGLPGKGGSKNQGGTSQSGDAGAGGAGAEGLRVSITSPAAASDPNTDEVLVADEVVVTCLAEAGTDGEAVDPSTVKIAVLDQNGDVIAGADKEPLEQVAAPTGNTDEYSAELSLVTVPSGPLSFRCTASGIEPSASGSDTVPALLDHGPTIVEKLPALNSAHTLTGVLAVEFTVTAAPLTDQDDEAGVASVKLFVAGAEITTVEEDPESPGTWRASVDFQDPELFDEPPTEHTSVRIEATNQRTTEAATAVLDYPFVVDGRGPAIAFVRPRANAPINGETVIEFTAADSGAGLDEDTVELTVTGLDGPFKYDADDTTRWGRKGSNFTFRFDTGLLEDIESQVSVAVEASDTAGNSTHGVTLLLYLDDLPPLIDLDPANARGMDSQNVCSVSFDPLGDALDDGSKTAVRNNLFRAVIYDQTNHGSGQDVFYMAGADRGSARLYLQPDASQPFLVDEDGDGTCDNLANENFDYQSLNPIPKSGSLTYGRDATEAPLPGGICSLRDESGTPDKMCSEQSDMSVVVQHDVDTSADEPVVYAMGNLAGFECTGSKWDLGPHVEHDGWVCLAVRASDRLGNVGISRPLRICFDDPVVAGAPACATSDEPPPSCTTNCVPPAAFGPHIFRF